MITQLIPEYFSLSLYLLLSTWLKDTSHTTIFKNLQNTNSSIEEHLAIAQVGVSTKKKLHGTPEIC